MIARRRCTGHAWIVDMVTLDGWPAATFSAQTATVGVTFVNGHCVPPAITSISHAQNAAQLAAESERTMILAILAFANVDGTRGITAVGRCGDGMNQMRLRRA